MRLSQQFRNCVIMIVAAAIITFVALQSNSGAGQVAITLEPDTHAVLPHNPTRAAITLPERLARESVEDLPVTVFQGDLQNATPGQIVVEGDSTHLYWIIPESAQPNEPWKAVISEQPSDEPVFSWQDSPDSYLDLLFDGRGVTRYMYLADTSSDRAAHETFKVYHHVFDETGTDFITKGPGGLFTHHRGIYIGWNQLRYDDDKTDDWWHMREGVTQRHQEFTHLIAGPVLAKSTAVIHWNDAKGQPVVIEQRTLTAYRQDDGSLALLDFESLLKPARSDIYLGGDPEHAGVQYRASNYVADHTADQTVYIFDDPQADPRRDRDMPWAAMRYYMNDSTYNVQQMNCPANPADTLFSAYRDYGRFGAFFVTDVEMDDPLEIRYRFWISNQSQDRETMRQRYSAFTKLSDMN